MPIVPREFKIGLLVTALLEDRYNKTGHIRDQARDIAKRYEQKLAPFGPVVNPGFFEELFSAELWLLNDLHRPVFEGFQRALRPLSDEAGADHHRYGVLRHDLPQEGQPVHAGHLQIEGQHVRRECDDLVASHVRIASRANDFEAGILVERVRDGATHDRRVVHHQHADLSIRAHAIFIRFSTWLIESWAGQSATLWQMKVGRRIWPVCWLLRTDAWPADLVSRWAAPTWPIEVIGPATDPTGLDHDLTREPMAVPSPPGALGEDGPAPANPHAAGAPLLGEGLGGAASDRKEMTHEPPDAR